MAGSPRCPIPQDFRSQPPIRRWATKATAGGTAISASVPHIVWRALAALLAAAGAAPAHLGATAPLAPITPAAEPPAGTPWTLDGPEYRRITFPVEGYGPSTYVDTWHAHRAGGRLHEGQDIIVPRLSHVLAARSGTIMRVKDTADGTSGNMLAIRDAEGYQYWYMHLSNDSPGTDDGTNPPEWRFAPGIVLGARVTQGQLIAYSGDSGDAENSVPHLHFEIHHPAGDAFNAYASLRLANGVPADAVRCAYDDNPLPAPGVRTSAGYWVAAGNGAVLAFGGARVYGSAPALATGTSIVRIAPNPRGGGYWLLADSGAVFASGTATAFGSTPSLGTGARTKDIAATPDGGGYWVATSDGRVFAFGNAAQYGSTSALGNASALSGFATTPTGRGYWIATADGNVSAFGDATAYGSATGGAATVAFTAAPDGTGYWTLDAAGEVHPYGSALQYGAPAHDGLCTRAAAVAIAATPTGLGYWVLRADGRVRAFGDATSFGDAAPMAAPAVAFAPRRPAPTPIGRTFARH